MTIRYTTNTIEMTKKFAKAAEKFGSDEYKSLQEAKRGNPTFKVVIVSRKATEKKDSYKGLTYEYMEKYIKTHDDAEAKMNEYLNLRGLSEEAQDALAEPCSYNEIRAWFLKSYPAIAKFHEERVKLMAS